jgi:hypothetical protein
VWPPRHDVHVEPNQLGREGGEPVSVVAVESTLDEDVLALDVSQLPHPLEESLPGAPGPRAVRRRAPQKAYPIGFCGRLRLGDERRGEEGEGECGWHCESGESHAVLLLSRRPERRQARWDPVGDRPDPTASQPTAPDGDAAP